MIILQSIQKEKKKTFLLMIFLWILPLKQTLVIMNLLSVLVLKMIEIKVEESAPYLVQPSHS